MEKKKEPQKIRSVFFFKTKRQYNGRNEFCFIWYGICQIDRLRESSVNRNINDDSPTLGSHFYVLFIFTCHGFQHLNVLTSIDERN